MTWGMKFSFNLKYQKKKKKKISATKMQRKAWNGKKYVICQRDKSHDDIIGFNINGKECYEAGCVVSSYRHSICTLDRAEKRKYTYMYFLVFFCKLHYNPLALYWCQVSTWFKNIPDTCLNSGNKLSQYHFKIKRNSS